MQKQRMSDGSPMPPDEQHIGATEARMRFAEMIGRVAYARERFVITRNGQDMGIFISMADYERYARFERSQQAMAQTDGSPPANRQTRWRPAKRSPKKTDEKVTWPS